MLYGGWRAWRGASSVTLLKKFGRASDRRANGAARSDGTVVCQRRRASLAVVIRCGIGSRCCGAWT